VQAPSFRGSFGGCSRALPCRPTPSRRGGFSRLPGELRAPGLVPASSRSLSRCSSSASAWVSPCPGAELLQKYSQTLENTALTKGKTREKDELHGQQERQQERWKPSEKGWLSPGNGVAPGHAPDPGLQHRAGGNSHL